MNIQTLLKNSGNANLITRTNLQSNRQQTQQAQQPKNEQKDEYIHQEIKQGKTNAVIYSDSSVKTAGEIAEKDSETVSFNPYTFDSEATQESENAENQPEKDSGDSQANNNMAVRANDSQKAQQGGAPVTNSASNEESDSDTGDDESELEALELERARIRQNLNTEQDISKKESLRVELRSVESQISQLKAELNK